MTQPQPPRQPQELTLAAVLELIDHGAIPGHLTVYVAAVEPITAETPAVLVDEECGDDPQDMKYFLEVDLIAEVFRVWSDWREGRRPSPADRFAAARYYAVHDAWLPVTRLSHGPA